MQVVVIEGETFRVERKNVRKGQGRTLAEFSRQGGYGYERVSQYLALKRHTLVERIVQRKMCECRGMDEAPGCDHKAKKG